MKEVPLGPRDHSEFRLIQNGDTVAKVSGLRFQAIPEIIRYAVEYGSDGLPVHIEELIAGEWTRLT